MALFENRPFWMARCIVLLLGADKKNIKTTWHTFDQDITSKIGTSLAWFGEVLVEIFRKPSEILMPFLLRAASGFRSKNNFCSPISHTHSRIEKWLCYYQNFALLDWFCYLTPVTSQKRFWSVREPNQWLCSNHLTRNVSFHMYIYPKPTIPGVTKTWVVFCWILP